jgi:hypothetical protein
MGNRHETRVFSLYYTVFPSHLNSSNEMRQYNSYITGRETMKIHQLPDEKSRALKQQNLLYPKASAVSDELFQTLTFFDPRDLLQVKYEMVRRVHKDGWSVSRAAAAFGFSRISFSRIQHAFQAKGVSAPAFLWPGVPLPCALDSPAEVADSRNTTQGLMCRTPEQRRELGSVHGIRAIGVQRWMTAWTCSAST